MPTIDTIQNAVSELGKLYGAERIFLFGSYAKGLANEDSDIDLRIDKGNIHGFFKLAGLKLDLEERLNRDVDLLPTDSLDEKFLSRIKREEILLYEIE